VTGFELKPGSRSGRILIILHQETSSTGRVGQLLALMGYEADIRRPVLGDPLPATLDDHAGAVVFGGPMSANDDDDGIRRETRFMDVVLKSGKPYLGICLGAQILVNHLGGRVATRDDGLVEIGWYGLEATPAGQTMMDWPSMVYQFHREGFDLPRGAELLATADAYPNQAFPLRRQCLGDPVSRRVDAGDDASLGGARRPQVRSARCAQHGRQHHRWPHCS
jgi:GMP synthase (glutamine-hydrolysing)